METKATKLIINVFRHKNLTKTYRTDAKAHAQHKKDAFELYSKEDNSVGYST